ncbi:MAG: hypothetical protein HQK66_07255 [Desulfamplus sp.]|nr:hypothetical protein [Desulfamplus sp.]
MNPRAAFVFDLDGTINHGERIPGSLEIFGTVGSSFIARRTMDLLLKISAKLKLFVNTARSQLHIRDFQRHFKAHEIPVTGWILEHGAVVSGKPEWTRRVLEGIDLKKVHERICAVVHQKSLPVDTDCYRNSHRGFLLYSCPGSLGPERFVSAVEPILGGAFRVISGERKVSIIPGKADKLSAFQSNFGDEYAISFAAGDSAPDIPLLRQALYPLTLAGASWEVKNSVMERGGFVSTINGHAGTEEFLEFILQLL